MDRTGLANRYNGVKASLPPGVKLIAVSKTQSVEDIQALYDLGQRAFGENYPQEIRDKQPLLPADVEWHFIGSLQSNKVKYLFPFIHLVHSVDRTALLDELAKRAEKTGANPGVLLQVHIAREETKQGFAPEDLRRLMAEGRLRERWPSLRFCGLMGMATNTEDHNQVRHEFDMLAQLHGELRQAGAVDPEVFKELSMGMSHDLQEAVSAGTTMVRIGTAIFGPRG